MPTPGAAVHRDEMRTLVTHSAGERVVEQLELFLAPHERDRQDEPAADLLGNRDDAPRLDPCREAACCLRPERRRHDGAARQPLDIGAEHDLARGRRLLEPCGRVDREARRESRVVLVREDLARLDPDPHLETEVDDCIDDRQRCPHGALRVVLVCKREPECGHHGVAREFLRRSRRAP